MASQSPIGRSFMILCFTAAGLLAAGAWYDYLAAAQRRAEGLFQTSRSYGTARTLSLAPKAIAARNVRLIIDLSQRRLTVYRGDEEVTHYPVAIGQDDWATPIGQFSVTDMREDPIWQHPITKQAVGPGAANPLGSRWVGFWSDGQYHIGIHGTNAESLIGGAVSHGCVRMRNADIEDVFNRISLSTPIQVQP